MRGQTTLSNGNSQPGLAPVGPLWPSHSGDLHDGPSADLDELGVAERRMLERGKKQQKETTEAANRALQLAEQTADIASATLVEVQRQGQALDRTEMGMDVMEKDVREATSVMRFMRRWCCFQVLCCCDCFDPHADMEQTRRRRIQERTKHQMAITDSMAAQKEAQQAGVSRILKKNDPAYNGNEAAARSELLAANHGTRGPGAAENGPPGLGYGLSHADAQEVQAEAAKQDKVLDKIGTTVEGLRAMGMELQRELEEQAPQIDGLGERTQTAHENLGSLSRSARKV